jgi:hypothetical protein
MTDQTPDTRPGFYYVSVMRDGSRGRQYVRLRGPYPTHTEALDAVPMARHEAIDRDPRGTPYSAAELASIKESAK